MPKKNTFTQHLKQSWKALMKDKLFIPLYAVLDLALVVLTFSAIIGIYERIIPVLEEVTAVAQKNVEAIQNATTNPTTTPPILARQEAVMQQMDEIFKLTLLLVLSLYLLWTVLQGVNVSLALQRLRGTRLLRTFGAFSLYSLGAMLLLLLVLASYVRFSVFNQMVLGMLSQTTITLVFFLILLVVGYFLYSGFTLIGRVPLKRFHRRLFSEPIHHFRLLSAKYLFTLGSLLVAHILYLIIFYVFQNSIFVFLSLLFFVLLVLPVVAYLRYLLLYSDTKG